VALPAPMLDFPVRGIYPVQEMTHPPALSPALAAALQSAGWSLRPGQEPASHWMTRGTRRLPIFHRRSGDARRAILQALLADAILRGRASARGPFLALVSAPVISPAMAGALEAYAAEVAPGQPFGCVDDRGLVRLKGLGLESAGKEPVRPPRQRGGSARTPDIFSDLNQWLLKVLVGRALPERMLSIPSAPVRSATELAQRGGVSVPAAWRLHRALQDAGHLGGSGQVVLVPELLARWRAASQRPQRRLGARWILAGRKPRARLEEALAAQWGQQPEPSACLGLFAACDALGLGHVRGAPLHVYVRHASPSLLEALGLVVAEKGQTPDVVVQVARWPESVFRAAVLRKGVPVADAIQCWLDVSAEPTRGAEQAAVLWRRVLAPALAPGEPEP